MAINNQYPCSREDHLAQDSIWILGAENSPELTVRRKAEPESYRFKEVNPASDLHKPLRKCFAADESPRMEDTLMLALMLFEQRILWSHLQTSDPQKL